MEPVGGIRVIDVIRKNIVPAPPGCRYLALSYVWGKPLLHQKTTATTRKALKSNVAELSKEGGLACLELPRTIRNAMTLTEELEEQYLWVDALCIVQDDVEDVQRQTAAMDSIYAGASLTIVPLWLLPGTAQTTACPA